MTETPAVMLICVCVSKAKKKKVASIRFELKGDLNDPSAPTHPAGNEVQEFKSLGSNSNLLLFYTKKFEQKFKFSKKSVEQ